MYKKKCAVVIPLYKTNLTSGENISLQQVSKVLFEYDIIAVIPIGVNIKKEIFTRIERFESIYFSSISAYNRLMLSLDFYKRFRDYEYILIYQLDALVFKNQLSFFCGLGYDYIGAPWLYGIFNYIDAEHSVFHVGNGGLSLRCVNAFIKLLEKKPILLGKQDKNEDMFFSSIVSPEFKIAPLEIALQFAFERQVNRCYELNHCELPFGCHAWERYNYNFWKPYIEMQGYVLKNNSNEFANEDNMRKEEYECYTRLSYFFENDFDKEKLRQKIENRWLLGQKNLIIFGAGFYGEAFAKCFKDIGISLGGFLDNDEDLVGSMLLDYPILPVNKIKNYKKKSFIFIANLECEVSMEKQLLKNGLKRDKDYTTFSNFVNLLYKGVSE